MSSSEVSSPYWISIMWHGGLSLSLIIWCHSPTPILITSSVVRSITSNNSGLPGINWSISVSNRDILTHYFGIFENINIWWAYEEIQLYHHLPKMTNILLKYAKSFKRNVTFINSNHTGSSLVSSARTDKLFQNFKSESCLGFVSFIGQMLRQQMIKHVKSP